MTQVNLLPWRERTKQEKKTRFIIVAIGVIILALITIIIAHIYYRHEINLQLSRNDYLTSELGKVQGKLNLLNAKKRELLAFNNELNFLLSLREKNYYAIRLLDTLAKITPDAVYLNKIEQKGRSVIIIGKANSDSQITLFIENLTKAKIFKQPELSHITAKESKSGNERIFQVKVEYQDKK